MKLQVTFDFDNVSDLEKFLEKTGESKLSPLVTFRILEARQLLFAVGWKESSGWNDLRVLEKLRQIPTLIDSGSWDASQFKEENVRTLIFVLAAIARGDRLSITPGPR